MTKILSTLIYLFNLLIITALFQDLFWHELIKNHMMSVIPFREFEHCYMMNSSVASSNTTSYSKTLRLMHFYGISISFNGMHYTEISQHLHICPATWHSQISHAVAENFYTLDWLKFSWPISYKLALKWFNIPAKYIHHLEHSWPIKIFNLKLRTNFVNLSSPIPQLIYDAHIM